MPLLLCLPLVGVAVLVACVTRVNKPSASRTATKVVERHQFELDTGMPKELVEGVLAALVLEADRTKLEAYAEKLAATYPLAAAELRAKAAKLAGGDSGSSGSTAQATRLPAPLAGDLGDAARVLQAAMTAYAHETDPGVLEGFAASIRTKYPTATILLADRARELRAFGSPAVSSTTSGAVPAIGVAPASPSSTSYVVRVGDTPTKIAERFTHEGRRWPELVAANPSKSRTSDGAFESLRPGETLQLPAAWTSSTPSASEVHP